MKADEHDKMYLLKLDIDQLDVQCNISKDEPAKIENAIDIKKSQNVVLLEKLVNTNRQLVSASLYIVQKNELLNQLKNNVQKIGGQLPNINKDFKIIESNIQNNQFLGNDRDTFKRHFEEVYSSIFTDL
jgi:hypothetical protein